jgi:hypothetical protein
MSSSRSDQQSTTSTPASSSSSAPIAITQPQLLTLKHKSTTASSPRTTEANRTRLTALLSSFGNISMSDMDRQLTSAASETRSRSAAETKGGLSNEQGRRSGEQRQRNRVTVAQTSGLHGLGPAQSSSTDSTSDRKRSNPFLVVGPPTNQHGRSAPLSPASDLKSRLLPRSRAHEKTKENQLMDMGIPGLTATTNGLTRSQWPRSKMTSHQVRAANAIPTSPTKRLRSDTTVKEETPSSSRSDLPAPPSGFRSDANHLGASTRSLGSGPFGSSRGSFTAHARDRQQSISWSAAQTEVAGMDDYAMGDEGCFVRDEHQGMMQDHQAANFEMYMELIDFPK